MKGDNVNNIPKNQLPKCEGAFKCPLKVNHPPNGEEYSLGCFDCMSEIANQSEI
jgi:hypothetical protein